MRRNKYMWIIGIVVVVLGLVVGLQIYLMKSAKRQMERAIRTERSIHYPVVPH